MVSTNTSPVLLKDATLEQIVQAISAEIEAKELNYTEEELAIASENIKAAISRINSAWNLQNSPPFRLPDHLILRIFEHLQGLAHESPSRTHPKWWDWLNVTSVCRAWWRISTEGSSLWENVHITYKMPVSFLGLILDRAAGKQLAVHFRSSDYLHSKIRREGYLRTIQPIADRIKSLTIHVTISEWHWRIEHIPKLFAVPYPNLESLDLSYNAFRIPRHHRQSLYCPDIGDVNGPGVLELINLIPTGQLKHLTLRHMKRWPPTYFGSLASLTLFGYADGTTLAAAVPAIPALQKLKLESIKNRERYSCDPERLVKLDGQTLELARCNPNLLNMFALSSTCSLVVTQAMSQYAIAHGKGFQELWWLPDNLPAIRCLDGIEEVHFSITKRPGRKGWIASEQKTVCYSTSGSVPKPSATFILTYHFDARTPLHKIPFGPKLLLPYPTPWGWVTRASFDGFHDQFRIRSNAVLKTLPNLRSLTLRRCDSGDLIRSITPDELRGLESLCFEGELSGENFGDILSRMFELRHALPGLQLEDKDLKIVIAVSGDPSSMISAEQMGRLKEYVHSVEATKVPGYSSVTTKYN